jgi:DNA invertase Pin-like site-specific DNA recombinase
MKHMKRRTALYCRTASNTETSAGIEGQLEALRGLDGNRAGDRENPLVFIDRGESGTTLDRPAMNELIDGIRAGEIGAVAVFGLDRIARSFALVSEWFDLLGRYDVRFIDTKNGVCALRSIDEIVGRIAGKGGENCA